MLTVLVCACVQTAKMELQASSALQTLATAKKQKQSKPSKTAVVEEDAEGKEQAEAPTEGSAASHDTIARKGTTHPEAGTGGLTVGQATSLSLLLP